MRWTGRATSSRARIADHPCTATRAATRLIRTSTQWTNLHPRSTEIRINKPKTGHTKTGWNARKQTRSWSRGKRFESARRLSVLLRFAGKTQGSKRGTGRATGFRTATHYCNASSKLASLLKYACPPGLGIGCWKRLIGSIVLQVCSGRRHRYDGYEGAQLPTTPRRHLPRRSRARGQLLPYSSGEARSLLR